MIWWRLDVAVRVRVEVCQLCRSRREKSDNNVRAEATWETLIPGTRSSDGMWIRVSDVMERWWRPRVTFEKPAAGWAWIGCTELRCAALN